MATLQLLDVSKTFSSRSGVVEALRPVSVEVEHGALVSIIGPSGCGKSTLFNIAAGLLPPTTGRVLIDDAEVTGQAGRVGYMLQKDLLLPWRTVIDNVILGLEVQRVAKRDARDRVRPFLQRYGLDGFEHHYPSELSGGMRQRAALMRTLLADATIVLLDEPFGALDTQTRSLMQEWLLAVKSELDKTILLVTHDVDEAVLLSDRIHVMTARPGEIKDTITIDLPRPRTIEMVTSPDFVEHKARVLATLRAETRRAFKLGA
jgi:ABC-type nitrate/sulfonate/bicarbonate transport system ATPase subunit